VREFNHDSYETGRRVERTGYAEWIALGAVAAGSIGAIVGMANCSRSRKSSATSEALTDSSTVTAPHGDKLLGGVI
jgi:hypothetical protein